MLSTTDVWRITLILTLQFSFIFFGQCKQDVNDQGANFLRKSLAASLMMENNGIDNGIDVWALTDPECYNQIKIMRSAAASGEDWAKQMLSASSTNASRFHKIDSMDNFRFFDMCTSIKTEKNNELISGNYCQHVFNIILDMRYAVVVTEFATCYPSGCDKMQIENVLHQLEKNFTASDIYNLSIFYNSPTCNSMEHISENIGGFITMVILAVFICVLLLSTICDIYIRIIKCGNTKNNFLKILSEFSLYTNSLRVLSTKAPQDNLPVISGLRFISMCWVILEHSYIVYLQNIINDGDVWPWYKSWHSIHYLISGFSVDTFFVLSGCLVSYIFLNKMSKSNKFNPLQYYVHRYIRLTPAVGALLLLTIFIFPYINLGPLWFDFIAKQKENCSFTWWPMLLYIQNYVETDHILCQDHLWYLAVDMQLFLISPLILYPLAKKPRIGLVILALLFIVSIITPAIISAKNEYSNALLLGFNANPIDAGINFFMAPYNRAGPWLMGIFLGYILVHKKGQTNKIFMSLAWILIALALGFTFFSYRFYQSISNSQSGDYHMYWEIFYAGFSHHIWGLCVCCTIYVCSFGYGGIVNKFLSLPIFLPLGKISYSVYVIHFIILRIISTSDRVKPYFTGLDIISKYFSMMIWSLIGGLIFCLIFETPFLVLEKIIRGKKTHVPTVQNDVLGDLKSSLSSTKLQDEFQSHDVIQTKF